MGEEAEEEEAELEVLEHVAFLFEPKLSTKMNPPPVRGGVELQARSRDHVGGRGRAQ